MTTYRIQRRVDAYDIYEVEASAPGEALAIIAEYDGTDKRVRALDLNATSGPGELTCDTVVFVAEIERSSNQEEKRFITNSAVADWLTRDKSPRAGQVVTTDGHHAADLRRMAIDMVSVLAAAEHPNVTDAVRGFVAKRIHPPQHPITALLALPRNSMLFHSNEARDLVLTLHDMLNEVAPDGCFFGAKTDSNKLGFWEVGPAS